MVERRLSEIPGRIPNQPILRVAFWWHLALAEKAGHAGRNGEDDAMLTSDVEARVRLDGWTMRHPVNCLVEKRLSPAALRSPDLKGRSTLVAVN